MAKILIVDDSDANLKLMGQELARPDALNAVAQEIEELTQVDSSWGE